MTLLAPQINYLDNNTIPNRRAFITDLARTLNSNTTFYSLKQQLRNAGFEAMINGRNLEVVEPISGVSVATGPNKQGNLNNMTLQMLNIKYIDQFLTKAYNALGEIQVKRDELSPRIPEVESELRLRLGRALEGITFHVGLDQRNNFIARFEYPQHRDYDFTKELPQTIYNTNGKLNSTELLKHLPSIRNDLVDRQKRSAPIEGVVKRAASPVMQAVIVAPVVNPLPVTPVIISPIQPTPEGIKTMSPVTTTPATETPSFRQNGKHIESFGRLLQDRRNEREMSEAELAREIHTQARNSKKPIEEEVTAATVEEWESFTALPKESTFELIKKVLIEDNEKIQTNQKDTAASELEAAYQSALLAFGRMEKGKGMKGDMGLVNKFVSRMTDLRTEMGLSEEQFAEAIQKATGPVIEADTLEKLSSEKPWQAIIEIEDGKKPSPALKEMIVNALVAGKDEVTTTRWRKELDESYASSFSDKEAAKPKATVRAKN